MPLGPALPPEWPAVLAALDEARARGFVGGGQAVDALAEHARGFVDPIAGATRVLDLGSGGGVPGLVIAALRPDAIVTLLDASVSRTDWLRRVVGRLGWADRVQVVTGRAEVLAHDDDWRGSQDAVVARSFAPPLVTAEVAQRPAARRRAAGGQRAADARPDALAGRGAGRARPPPASRGPIRRYAVLEAIASPRPEVPRPRVVRGHTS